MVTLTPAAVEKIKTFFQQEETAKGKALRIAVEKGGCSGYQYAFMFDEKKDGDQEASFEGFSVVVDAESDTFLSGSTVDYHEDMTGSGFKINNPKVKKSCGCGNSHQF